MAEKEKEIPVDLEVNNFKEDMQNDSPMPSDGPTDEEKAQAKEEFEAAKDAWEKVKYDLAPSIDMVDNFVQYIENFLNNFTVWAQNSWMGAIKMEEELEDVKRHFSANPEEVPQISYQALEYLYHVLVNPGGVGLEKAKAFEAGISEHKFVMDFIEARLKEARDALTEIKFLQEKWMAYEQGFYYDREPTDEEMPEGSYYDDDLEKFVKPGDEAYDIQKFMDKVEEQYGKETRDQVEADMKAEEAAKQEN